MEKGRNELIFINEEYFFETFGIASDDLYLFYGKLYFVDYNSEGTATITNPRQRKFGPFELKLELVEKLFCTKIQYRKHKLKKLNDISKIL